MHLFVVRHAIAIDRMDPSVSSDEERWLTDEGIEKMKRAVRGFHALVPTLDVIYTSPWKRAVETAGLLAAGLDNQPHVIRDDSLEPPVDFDDVQALLSSHRSGSSIALVGHEPDLSEFISTAICGDDSAVIQMKKGAVAWLELLQPLQPGRAHLLGLLQPKVLRSLAR